MGPAVPTKRPRRAAYALPTLFTSGNIFLGFVAIMYAFEGARLGDPGRYSAAAIAIGFAVFFDGLDGRVARMTNTTSDFGRELDSLADMITFGIAPAVLAYVWGVLDVQAPNAAMYHQLTAAGYFFAFFFLLCGAVRLARFNVTTNPVPMNPGRPDRKYFVGMAIPAGAGFIAAVVYFSPTPIHDWIASIVWMLTLAISGLLMVSTWRYPSFKQINIGKPRSPLFVLLVGAFFLLMWKWSQPLLLIMASTYFVSGIAIRVGGVIRRHRRPSPPPPQPSEQLIG